MLKKISDLFCQLEYRCIGFWRVLFSLRALSFLDEKIKIKKCMVFRNILRMKGLKCTRANKRLIWFYDVPIQYLYEKKNKKNEAFMMN